VLITELRQSLEASVQDGRTLELCEVGVEKLGLFESLPQ
jgi:hypothetical protein